MMQIAQIIAYLVSVGIEVGMTSYQLSQALDEEGNVSPEMKAALQNRMDAAVDRWRNT